MRIDTPDQTQPQGSSIVRAFTIIRERWGVIAMATILCAGAALLYSMSQEEKFEASASLLFRNPGLSDALFGAAAFEPSLDPTRESSTNIRLVKARGVSEQVRDRLNLSTSAEDLLDQVEVEEQEHADVVDIIVTDEDPRQAARIADAFASEYIDFRRRADRQKVREAQDLIRDRLDSLPPDSEAADRANLREALQKLISLEAVQTGNAEVVDRPTVPTVAASPKTKRDVALAGILGLFLGVLIAFLLDVLDRRVKSVEEFEQRYGISALATIPQIAFSPGRKNQPASAALEPYRILFTSLRFLSVGSPIRVIMVTSAVPEEGKTSVAVNLARAVALAGRTVAVVEGDLRRPTFHKHFDLRESSGGLTNALVTTRPASDLLVHVRPQTGQAPVSVLPSGPLPPNSAELLASDEMGSVLEELASEYDYVIVDAAPLLPIADAQILLDRPEIDACLVVGRLFKSTRDQVQRSRAIIDQHRVERVGLVITGQKEAPGSYEYYSARGDLMDQATPTRDRAERSRA
jgi:receptor protein-tyrosine kinase